LAAGEGAFLNVIRSNEYMTSERRRHRRSDVANVMEYIMDSIDSLNSEEVFDGVIANISESGLCLLSTTYLSQGEQIHILKHDNPQSFQTASVRWSQKSNEFYCKAGVEFI
jgi:hypothetical protein